MFVNTCSEKRVVAERVVHELGYVHPRPPAVRLFDAGVGDGTVLARVMRGMHQRFETLPFYIVGKEISLEDVRLTLEKAPDRFYEHPATVLILTNLYYAEAPYLIPASPATAARLVWHEVALTGRTSAEFEQQINALEPFLAKNWRASVSKKTGNPVYETPVVLVLYLESQRFLLNSVIPRRGAITADYDLVIASQPYRARASAAFKAQKVIAPLAQSLAPGGRLLGIHSCGDDPGLEIVQAVWPGEMPFITNRHDILRETRSALGSKARNFSFQATLGPAGEVPVPDVHAAKRDQRRNDFDRHLDPAGCLEQRDLCRPGRGRAPVRSDVDIGLSGKDQASPEQAQRAVVQRRILHHCTQT